MTDYGIIIDDDEELFDFFSEKEVCPLCGEELYKEGRCGTCLNCGYSKCDL